jgi:hypothetical protein
MYGLMSALTIMRHPSNPGRSVFLWGKQKRIAPISQAIPQNHPIANLQIKRRRRRRIKTLKTVWKWKIGSSILSLRSLHLTYNIQPIPHTQSGSSMLLAVVVLMMTTFSAWRLQDEEGTELESRESGIIRDC